MDLGFKFNIGDVLTHKGFLVKTGDRFADETAGQKLFVVQRQIDECPGGIQHKYWVRCIAEGRMGEKAIVKDCYLFNEVELEPFVAKERPAK